MIYVVYTVIFAEMTSILLLLFKTPLRKLLIFALDHMKQGRAPLVVKSVGATVFTIMLYEIYNISSMRSRPIDTIGPTDQILLAYHMLEASLIGFSIFLLLMIDRLHYYIRELRTLRRIMDTGKKQKQGFEDGKNNGGDEVKALNEEISRLKTKISKLESEHAKKDNEVKSADKHLQSENRSLPDGNGSGSHSSGKKDM